jgi:hypothetical protein
MNNFSFKQFVENKDLNEVGQYVFGQGENMPSVATSLKGSDFPNQDAGRGKHDDFQVYDKKNVNLGFNDNRGGVAKSIFKVSQTPSGANISFTEEMKQHLNNNNEKDDGEEDFFGSGHEENEMIGSIGKSMLATAGSILDNQLQFAYEDFKQMKNIRTVSLEPIFEFLSQGMKGNVSVFKRLFPLFERGLKTVVYELNQKNKKDAEKFKKEKHSSGLSKYDAITKGSSTNIANKYFNKTNIELKGYNVVFSVTDDAFSPYKINPPDDFGNASDDARKLKQSRYKPAFRPPTA